MWNWLRNKLGLDRMEGKIDMTNASVLDLTTLVGQVADELPPIAADGDVVLAILTQLQANNGNPNNQTTLSADDQAAVNDAMAKLTNMKTGFSSLDAKLKAAAAPPATGTTGATGATGATGGTGDTGATGATGA